MSANVMRWAWTLALSLACTMPAYARWVKISSLDRVREPTFQERAILTQSTFLDDDRHGWVAGVTVPQPRRVVIIRTTDGGETWERLETGVRAKSVGDLEFVDPANGWMVTLSDRMLLHTADGGVTWRYEEMPGGGEANDISDVEMLTSQHGFAAGRADGQAALFEYRVTRGGRPPWWTPLPVGARGSVGTLVVHTPEWMWMLAGDVRGSETRAWRRAGSSELLPITGLSDLTCVWSAFFFDRNRGWLGGLWGDIWRTDDGGLTWGAQDSGIEAAVKGLCFISATEGVALGGNGEILATDNGGDDWRLVENLRSCCVDLDYFNGEYIVTNVSGLYHDAPPEIRIEALTPLHRHD